MLLKIIQFDVDELRMSTEPMKDKDFDQVLFDSFIKKMFHSRGIGLAANQVGINKSFFAMKDLGIFANPKIVHRSGKISTKEGCLSFPKIGATVERSLEITTTFLDRYGKEDERVFKGIDSIIFQHEYDHLLGKVFIDYLKPVKKRMVLEKIRKEIKKLKKTKRAYGY